MLHIYSSAQPVNIHERQMDDQRKSASNAPNPYTTQNASRESRQHQHLIQSPYKPPVLPPLHTPTEVARGAPDESTPRPKPAASAFTTSSTSGSQGLRPSISSPIPLKEWPYVHPASTSHPWDPAATQPTGKDSAQQSTLPAPPAPPRPSPPYEDVSVAAHPGQSASRHPSSSAEGGSRHPSVSTGGSSVFGDEEGTSNEKKSKKSSKLKARVKTKVKDLFAKPDKDEPVTAIRREPDPWYDEDY